MIVDKTVLALLVFRSLFRAALKYNPEFLDAMESLANLGDNVASPMKAMKINFKFNQVIWEPGPNVIKHFTSVIYE